MGSRGRQSGAELATGTAGNVLQLRIPPAAPPNLTKEQAATWDSIMKSSAGNLIAPEAFPVLVEYCRAIASANQVAKLVDAIDPDAPKEAEAFNRWTKLLAMQERMAGKVASLAVKLRIAPSTRIHPRGAGRNEARGGKLKPWETEG